MGVQLAAGDRPKSLSRSAAAPSFYHGTRYTFRPGQILRAERGRGNTVQDVAEGSHVYAATSPWHAAEYAEAAYGPPHNMDARPSVYHVEPVEGLERDPHPDEGVDAWRARSWRVVGPHQEATKYARGLADGTMGYREGSAGSARIEHEEFSPGSHWFEHYGPEGESSGHAVVEERPDHAYVRSIEVNRHMRGHGVGTELLDHAQRHFAPKPLRLKPHPLGRHEDDPDEDALRDFYRNRGFRDYEPGPEDGDPFAREMMERQAAGETLRNPSTGGREWYHGTTASGEQLAGGFRPTEHNPEAELGGHWAAHWNSLLGVHFAAHHGSADKFARPDSGVGGASGWQGGRTPSVVHARLHLANPKVYGSEHELSDDAYEHEYDQRRNHLSEHPDHSYAAGFYFGDDSDHHNRIGKGEWEDFDDFDEIGEHGEERPEPVYRRTQWLNLHPDKGGIAHRLRERLQAQGHDGIVYGNEEPAERVRSSRPEAHQVAIAFHPSQIEITKHHVHGDEHRTAARWEPSSGIFAPTTGFDATLFDGRHELRPEVRRDIMERLDQVLRVDAGQVGSDWQDWIRVYIAGGSASEWAGGRPNDAAQDLDVLLGVDYGQARRHSAAYAELDDAQIDASINAALRAMFNQQGWQPPFGGTWDLTGYVNHDAYDITAIKPYAAYDVTDMRWAVRPPHLPEHSVADFDPALIAEARAIASEARAILRLPEPARTHEARALWERIHSDRSRAFGPEGEGWTDPGNVLEKWLAYAPGDILGKIRELALTRTAAADYRAPSAPDLIHRVIHEREWRAAQERGYFGPSAETTSEGYGGWHPGTHLLAASWPVAGYAQKRGPHRIVSFDRTRHGWRPGDGYSADDVRRSDEQPRRHEVTWKTTERIPVEEIHSVSPPLGKTELDRASDGFPRQRTASAPADHLTLWHGAHHGDVDSIAATGLRPSGSGWTVTDSRDGAALIAGMRDWTAPKVVELHVPRDQAEAYLGDRADQPEGTVYSLKRQIPAAWVHQVHEASAQRTAALTRPAREDFAHELPDWHDPDEFRVHNGKYLLHEQRDGLITAHRIAPDGRLVAPEMPNFTQGHKVPRRVGYLSWFPGEHDPADTHKTIANGVIYKAYVSGPHRRKGLASAMLDFARERHPESNIRHSHALSEDGKAWAEKKASLDEDDGSVIVRTHHDLGWGPEHWARARREPWHAATQLAQRQVRLDHPNLTRPFPRAHEGGDEQVGRMLVRAGYPEDDVHGAFVARHPDPSRGTSNISWLNGRPGVALHPDRWDYGTVAHEAAHHVVMHRHALAPNEPQTDEQVHGPEWAGYYAHGLNALSKGAGDDFLRHHQRYRQMIHDQLQVMRPADLDEAAKSLPAAVWREASGSSAHERWVDCDQGHEHWGAHGAAGLLIRHKDPDTGLYRYLLQKRAPWVDEGGTWSTPGGALHRGESPEEGARRESEEEWGKLPAGLEHHHTHTDDHGGWAYHTVVMDSPERFTPGRGGETEDESDGHGWFTAREVRKLPLHSGFEKSWERVRRSGGRKEGVTGYEDLTPRSGMIYLDIPRELIREMPGGVDDFHITLVYLGKAVSNAAFEHACRRAAEAAARTPRLEGILRGVETFPPSDSSDHKTPVFVPAYVPGIGALRRELEDLSASQHRDYRPHVTLAYLEPGDAMPEPHPPVPVSFGHLCVKRGDDVVRFPLGNRH